MAAIEFYNVNTNVLRLYQASTEAQHLKNERFRTLKAERPWRNKNPASLLDLVLEVIANNFMVFSPWFYTDVLSDVDRKKILHVLPTDLPIQITSAIESDDSFWKRSCHDIWSAGDFMCRYRGSWKNLYMEVFLQIYIENAHPNNINLIELKEIIDLVKEYVYVLHIEQLQTIETPGNVECSIKHVDLRPILLSLIKLTELSIRVGVKNAGLKFSTSLFQLTNIDCCNIARGLEKSCNLTTFKIHQTPLDDRKVRIICSSFVTLPLLESVEFTSCCISNDSVTSLMETLKSCTQLKILILTNNKIGPDGSGFLASVLQQIGLHTLNLRLNSIRDDGALALFSSVQTHPTLEKLVLSGCKITFKSIEGLINLVKVNKRLREIDLNCNDLGKLADSPIIDAFKMNPNLRVHLKMNDIPT